MSYEFISSGGCERCDAMEGYYEEEPARPHPNCICQIVNLDTALAGGHIVTYYELDDPLDAPPGDSEIIFYIVFEVYLDCCGQGPVIQGQIEVEARYSDQDPPNSEEGPWSSDPDFILRLERELADEADRLEQQCPQPDCPGVV